MPRRPSIKRSGAIVGMIAMVATLFVGVEPSGARTVPICFPVSDSPVSYSSTSYGAPRSGHSHAGVDIMGQKMFRIVAPVNGEILSTLETDSSSGNRITMRGDDGIFYLFMHLNDDTPGTDDGNGSYAQSFGPGIREGVRVYAGQLLGYVGDSGNAENSGAHLHFEMRTPSSTSPHSEWAADPFDPYPSLKAARPCGNGSLTSPDIATLLPGDFDGDGKGELFAYVPGPGQDRVYKRRNNGDLTTVEVQNVSGTYQPLTGDFDGDGRTDILWYAPGPGTESIWYGTATTGKFDIGGAPVANGTYEPLLGDFDNDGLGDIMWYGPGTDPDYVWYGKSRRGAFSSYARTANGVYKPFSGDFDGDGRSDIMWYGPGTDPDYVWYGKGRRGDFSSYARTANGVYEPFTGDFDGDGHADVYWYAPGAPADYIWYGKGRGQYYSMNKNVGGSYDPVATDLDGDGHDDIVWWRRGTSSTPIWYGAARGKFTSKVL